MRDHIPEKDGILACLLVGEMVAKRCVSVRDMAEQIYKEVGKLVSGRLGVRLTREVQQTLLEKLATGPLDFGGHWIKTVSRVDGAKFILEDGSWSW
jgi:phosphoglucomutase